MHIFKCCVVPIVFLVDASGGKAADVAQVRSCITQHCIAVCV